MNEDNIERANETHSSYSGLQTAGAVAGGGQGSKPLARRNVPVNLQGNRDQAY